MSFSNPITGGQGALIRPAIKSPNYVPNVSGWSINRDGTAEFNDLFVRGEFSTGLPPSPRIVISDSPLPPFGGVPRIALYSGDAQETSPAFVANFVNGGVSWFEIDTSNDGFGINQLIGIAPQAGDSGGWLFATTFAGAEIGRVNMDVDMMLTLLNPNVSSLSSVNHAFQIGSDAAFNMVFDRQSLQARNAGFTAADMYLQYDGGNIEFSSFGADGTFIIVNDQPIALATSDQGLQIGTAPGANLAFDRQGLQARNAGAAAIMFLQKLGGNIEFGSFATDPSFIILNDATLALAGSPGFQIGSAAGFNLAFDRQIVQARNAGAVADLHVNYYGGNAFVFWGAAADTYSLNVKGFIVPGSSLADVTASDNTARTTASTSYVTASSTAKFNFNAPASGKAFFYWQSLLDNTVAGETASLSFRVTNTAETITWFSPSDSYRTRHVGTTGDFRSGFMLATGLPTSGILTARVMLKSSAAGNTAQTDVTSIGYFPVL